MSVSRRVCRRIDETGTMLSKVRCNAHTNTANTTHNNHFVVKFMLFNLNSTRRWTWTHVSASRSSYSELFSCGFFFRSFFNFLSACVCWSFGRVVCSEASNGRMPQSFCGGCCCCCCAKMWRKFVGWKQCGDDRMRCRHFYAEDDNIFISFDDTHTHDGVISHVVLLLSQGIHVTLSERNANKSEQLHASKKATQEDWTETQNAIKNVVAASYETWICRRLRRLRRRYQWRKMRGRGNDHGRADVNDKRVCLCVSPRQRIVTTKLRELIKFVIRILLVSSRTEQWTPFLSLILYVLTECIFFAFIFSFVSSFICAFVIFGC